MHVLILLSCGQAALINFLKEGDDNEIETRIEICSQACGETQSRTLASDATSRETTWKNSHPRTENS